MLLLSYYKVNLLERQRERIFDIGPQIVVVGLGSKKAFCFVFARWVCVRG